MNNSEGLVVDGKGRKGGGETARHAIVKKELKMVNGNGDVWREIY